MLKAAVVILNHNGKNYLEKFLPSVVQFSRECQVVVADNGSTDDSVAFLQANYPQVALIPIGRNEGFSKGYNMALQQLDAEYFVLLNSDVEVTPQWLPPLLRLMDADTQIAACQPKIKSYYQKNLFEYAGAAGGYIDKWGYPFCRGRIFDTIEADNGQYNSLQEVFWASGACMMVRAAVYREMGGLDNDFFAHMEEIDLCWRIKNSGYRVMYCGESQVYHVGGGTLPKSNARKTFLNFRNGLILLYKNLPAGKLWQTLLIRLILDGVAAVKFLFAGDFTNFGAVFRAHLHFYGYVVQHRIPRSGDEHEKTGTNSAQHKQIYQKSIVYAYFIQKKKTFRELSF